MSLNAGSGRVGGRLLPGGAEPCTGRRSPFRFAAAGGGWSLGGEALGGEWLERRRVREIRRRRGSLFLDLGEQPGLDRGSRPLSLRMIMSKTAGLEDYRAQFGDAAAANVVEVDKRKARAGHRILRERDRRCRWQAMLAPEMQKSADKAVTSVSVIITAARPVAVVGKKLEH